MCGIAGFQGRFSPEILHLFNDALSHRGPDDSGAWYSARALVGLAHRRLSIIDVSALGHQPMENRPRSALIVFNGEIYNFRELRRDLERNRQAFRSHSDTEVLLALYEAKGEAMLPFLNGIFAFAIWDEPDRSLFLACDAMGVKPVYFAQTVEGFLFASELKALMHTGTIPGTLDVASLFRTLGYLWSPGGAAPIRGVRRLGPGEALRVRDCRIVRQWTWAASTWPVEPIDVGPDEAARRVEESLRTAVHRQMVADVPVGAFLSGGVDSSAVVAMAREEAPQIECFTIDTGGVRDGGMTDDLPYARQVARHLGVKLHVVLIDSSQMAQDLEQMVAQLDEPLADPAPLNVLYISRLARQHGIKVLLSGAGGDDLFSGYRRHRALDFERYWSGLPRPVRAGLRRASGGLTAFGSAGRRIAKALAHADSTREQRLTGYFLWADVERIRTLFAPEHRAWLATERIEAPFEDYMRTLPPGMPPLQQMLALEQRFFLADHNLLYTDKMSMAAGVEVRVPFLDNDLVRLANALPAHLKQRGRQGKWVLKKAIERHLPCEILHRPKAGFGAPLRRWLQRDLRELVDDTLSNTTVRRRGLFDPVAVDTLIADDRAGRVDAAYTILGLMCIEIWFRNFLDFVPRRFTSGRVRLRASAVV
jgi:asparagine synthase (glutamine-hydrolysing)